MYMLIMTRIELLNTFIPDISICRIIKIEEVIMPGEVTELVICINNYDKVPYQIHRDEIRCKIKPLMEIIGYNDSYLFVRII